MEVPDAQNNHKRITDLIEQLNRELHTHAACLSFNYYDDRGFVKISIHYRNAEASYINLNPPDQGEMVLEFSRTLARFKERKLNKCLRYLAAMIASIQKCSLVSNAINPISLHTMTSIFGEDCEIKDPETGEEYKYVGPLTIERCKTYFPHDSPDKVIISRVVNIDYEKYERKLFEAIPTIKCTDLGGTRKRRKKIRKSIKYATPKLKRESF